ncbi:MAG: carbonic anhydrase [Roseivirga sp.]|nr:carbonic anhydrase [Roseivirga sp.]
MADKKKQSGKPCFIPCQNDPEAIYQRLKAGNKRYRKGRLKCLAKKRDRIESQRPYAVVLSCADSRVIPEQIFDTGPGELFVARVAGNIANTATIASIEYAVHVLGTRFIVVLGHEACGAVETAKKHTREPFEHSAPLGYNLDVLLAQIRPAIVSAGACASMRTLIEENARLNAIQLTERSQIIDKDKVILYYAYYTLGGKVEFTEVCFNAGSPV